MNYSIPHPIAKAAKSVAIFCVASILLATSAPAETGKYPKQAKQPPLATEEVQTENIKTEEAAAEAAKPADATKPEVGAGGIEAAADDSKIAAAEQLGPRQGVLRDAGRFKVELKPGKHGVDVYLINSAQGSPIIEGSRVEGQLYVGKREYELKFKPIPGQRKFHAAWPEKVGAEELEGTSGKEVALVLLPTRERIVGAPVLYKIEKLQE